MSTAGPAGPEVLDFQHKLNKLGIKFDPARTCKKHNSTEGFNSAIASAKKGQRAISTVEALIQRAEAEPQWQATRHYNWELGNWVRLSDEHDCSIDWIEYFQRECKEATRRFNCDLTTNMYCYRCVGCWLWWAPRSSDAVVVLADAVLNGSTPDHFRFEPEEELLIQEALAYHRGDLASESDEEDDGDDFYESGYESE
jgi:hypothetical protein